MLAPGNIQEQEKKRHQTHTMKETNCQGLMWHKLCDHQLLATLPAAADQIGQPVTPQSPNSPCVILHRHKKSHSIDPPKAMAYGGTIADETTPWCKLNELRIGGSRARQNG